MKIVIAAAVGLTTLLGSSLYLNVKNSAPSKPTEVITLPSSQSNATSASNTLSTTKQITKQNVNKDRVLYLSTEVNFESVRTLVNRIKELNAKSSDDIYLLIDSPGGGILDGATLVSEMEASKAHINTVCTRLCASMAAMIHSYGYKRYGTDRSILMYHPASAGAQGQVPNMLSQLTTMTKYINKMVSHTVSRSKVSQDEFDKLVAYELWIDAEDAVTRGFNDGIIYLNVPYSPDQQASFSASPPQENNQDKFQWISPHLGLWARK